MLVPRKRGRKKKLGPGVSLFSRRRKKDTLLCVAAVCSGSNIAPTFKVSVGSGVDRPARAQSSFLLQSCRRNSSLLVSWYAAASATISFPSSSAEISPSSKLFIGYSQSAIDQVIKTRETCRRCDETPDFFHTSQESHRRKLKRPMMTSSRTTDRPVTREKRTGP